MLNLNDRSWKEFFIEDICDIESGRDIYDAERVTGDTPYITSTAFNNGIKYFVNNNNYTLEANCISVNRNGSVGYSFYHKYLALYSNDCRKLRLKQHNNEFVALFITNQIMQQRYKYNYSIKMGTERLKRQKIMLPIDEDGNPDYAFMEQYIKEREKLLIERYKKYIDKIISMCECSSRYDSVEWKPFFLISDKMFYIDPVKTFKNTSNLNQHGIYDVVGATSKNNGNVGFLDDKYRNLLTQGNCICLIKTGQGSVGDAVYKYNDFIPSNNVCVIRSSWLNRYNALFIVSEINKQAERYSYGYIRNSKRILRETLMLPIDEQGNPNFAFMEQYMKQLEYELLQKYLEYLQFV